MLWEHELLKVFLMWLQQSIKGGSKKRKSQDHTEAPREEFGSRARCRCWVPKPVLKRRSMLRIRLYAVNVGDTTMRLCWSGPHAGISGNKDSACAGLMEWQHT